MAEKHTGFEIAKKETFSILQIPTPDLSELYKTNVGVDGVGFGDLDRVKIATGGNTVWVVPGVDGDQLVPEIQGVIVDVKDRRAFWKKAFGEGEPRVPPDCVSDDALTGHGIRFDGDKNEPHDCMTCPMNEFNTKMRHGQLTKGKACTQRKFVFLLPEDNILPVIVDLPPTSLRTFNKFLTATLIGKVKRPYTAVVTKFKLTKEMSSDGVPYAQACPSVAAELDEETMKALKERLMVIKDLIAKSRPIPVEPEEEV